MPFSKKRYRQITEPGKEAKGGRTRKKSNACFRTSGVQGYKSAEDDAAL
jgi:hypothetical protein